MDLAYERYGIAKDEAARQVEEFSSTYGTDETTTREEISVFA